MRHFRIRTIIQASALLLACAFHATPAIVTTSTFQFQGQCTDCTGKATATLVLANYTPGNSLGNANFISLTYSSNLLNFTLTSTDPNLFVNGTLPANLPGAANVNIFGTGNSTLQTQSNGSWCAGNACGGDFGTGATWSLTGAPVTPPTATGAPALSDLMLICLAAAIAVMGGILVKKTQTA